MKHHAQGQPGSRWQTEELNAHLMTPTVVPCPLDHSFFTTERKSLNKWYHGSSYLAWILQTIKWDDENSDLWKDLALGRENKLSLQKKGRERMVISTVGKSFFINEKQCMHVSISNK